MTQEHQGVIVQIVSLFENEEYEEKTDRDSGLVKWHLKKMEIPESLDKRTYFKIKSLLYNQHKISMKKYKLFMDKPDKWTNRFQIGQWILEKWILVLNEEEKQALQDKKTSQELNPESLQLLKDRKKFLERRYKNNPSKLKQELKRSYTDLVRCEFSDYIEDNKVLFDYLDQLALAHFQKEFGGFTLRDYQQTHANILLRSLLYYRHGLDSSGTGAGKTLIASSIARFLQDLVLDLNKKSLDLTITPIEKRLFQLLNKDGDYNLEEKPLTIIVCPKITLYNWRKFLKIWGVKNAIVVNYETLARGKHYVKGGVFKKGKNKGKIKIVKKLCPHISVTKNEGSDKKFRPKVIEWNVPSNTLIVFDEGHRCKNPKTTNTELMKTAKSTSKARILIASATIAESPVKMCGIGKVFGFYDKDYEFYGYRDNETGEMKGFYPTYDVQKVVVNRRTGASAYKFKGNHDTIKKLHQQMFGQRRASGIDVADLVARGLFPSSETFAELYYMNSHADDINSAYSDMAREIAENRAMRMAIANQIRKLKVVEDDNQIFEGKTIKQRIKELRLEAKSVENPLTIRLRYRQMVELAKIQTLVELTSDLLEENNSVVIFVNFRETLFQLQEKLSVLANRYDTEITSIYGRGSNSGALNEEHRLKFENNESRIMIANIQASREGIDLHDKYHVYNRVALISPCDSAQNLKQVLGRIHRTGGTHAINKIVYASDTIEEKVCQNVRAKISNINVLNDGDLDETKLF